MKFYIHIHIHIYKFSVDISISIDAYPAHMYPLNIRKTQMVSASVHYWLAYRLAYNLGVVVHSDFTMTTHVSAVYRAAYTNSGSCVRWYARCRLMPPAQVVSPGDEAFISTAWAVATELTTRSATTRTVPTLKAAQNAAARLITNTRTCEHITPVLQQLH